MNSVFFQEFLMISTIQTVIFIALLVVLFAVIGVMGKKNIDFSIRVIVAMFLGLGLGLLLQAVARFPDYPTDVVFIVEATAWFGLFGNGFMNLIRVIIIPLVMVSIVYIIINMHQDSKIGSLVRNTMIITLSMTALSAVIGLLIAKTFNLGEGMALDSGTAQIREVTSIVHTLNNLIPANPVVAMVNMNIIGILIFSMMFGIAAKKMHKEYPNALKPFFSLTNALHKIIISIALSIIKLMPYAIVPLLANTIAIRGLASILEVGRFIILIYVAIAIMFILQLVVISLFGLNPIMYLKKATHVLILAFTSRSSMGTLPVTIDALTKRLGVNNVTANFVASFGTTAGMQGCAGLFSSMLVVFIANASGTPIDITFIIMAVIVITVGSFGIAGVPGTATMAASVSLSGMGMAPYFAMISPIFAIDPIIDMGRTMLNVSGAMTNSLMVDKTLNRLDMDTYNSSLKEPPPA